MACIVYQKHKNGSTYAYRSESFRSPKTGRPTSRRVYLGRVDPETGEILPQRARPARPADGGPDRRDERIAELEAENARLLAAIAEARGLLGDADVVLGGVGDVGEETG